MCWRGLRRIATRSIVIFFPKAVGPLYPVIRIDASGPIDWGGTAHLGDLFKAVNLGQLPKLTALSGSLLAGECGQSSRETKMFFVSV